MAEKREVKYGARNWGVEDENGWGNAAVQHAMKYAHSTDLKELLATKDFVVPHMLLTLPPVLYDENMQVEKVFG